MTGLFFTLIKIAVGNLSVSEGLSCAPSAAEWKEALVTANKQTLIGVLLPAVEEVNKVYPVPYEIWMQWNFFSQKIIEKNRKMDQKVIELGQILEKDGFKYCILKGQGVARYYPRPELRTPGDIDVWMWPGNCEASLSERREIIVKYVRDQFPETIAMYHHIDFPIFAKNKIEVEAHFTPSWMFSFRHNRKLQKYFESGASEQFHDNLTIGLNSPCWEFNCIFMLNHIYRHLFDEGIGLRQLMDYCLVLTSHKAGMDEKERLVSILKSVGLYRFAGAVMYILKEIFGIHEAYIITPIDKIEGSHLLKEIMASGNFGKFDTRKATASIEESTLDRIARRICHSFSLIARYPSEALSEMPFRIWQYWWRRKNGYV